MSSFTNTGEEIMKRCLPEGIQQASSLNLEEMYEISSCVDWIKLGAYSKVGLQFPDELLGDAAAVAEAMMKHLGQLVYILGDTTYGSCCVDEVAAQHVGADAVIHFGHTCLSVSPRLPVLYVPTRLPVDVPVVAEQLRSVLEKDGKHLHPLILLSDTRCHYAAGELFSVLHHQFPRLLTSTLEGVLGEGQSVQKTHTKVKKQPENENENMSKCNGNIKDSCSDVENCSNSFKGKPFASKCSTEYKKNTECINHNEAHTDSNIVSENCDETLGNHSTKLSFSGRSVLLPLGTDIKDCSFIYVGPRGPTLDTLLLRFSESDFYHVCVNKGTAVKLSGMQSLMRRNVKLEKIRDADIIGILVGTLGIARYQEAIARLKLIIKNAGKRSYTFVVGKPNEPKLANISEVDIFVYVSCPETTLVDHISDPVLYRKLVTPWEVEVALVAGREWSLTFESDFKELLPGGACHLEVSDTPREEEASISLITNKTQTLGLREDAISLDGESGAVVVQEGRALATLHVGGGGQALGGRSWAGLDPSLPPPAPYPTVVEGRRGIAAEYQDEKQ